MAQNQTITTSWHSYPSPKAIGHAMVRNLFDDPIVIEEKIDGSQFSFGLIGGELKVRSKGVEINLLSPEPMFNRAIETAQKLAPILTPEWTYRCEYLKAKDHNVLIYDRTPKDFLIIIDINKGHEVYLSPKEKAAEAARIGLECAPCFYEGRLDLNATDIRKFLSIPSVLGGAIEGMVIKNYSKFTQDGKVMMGKLVCEDFKEVATEVFKEKNPGSADFREMLGLKYKTQARWQKALQHLTEAGRITGTPQDIGLLMTEVKEDIARECAEEIKQQLFDWAYPNIARMSVSQLPEWYKEVLLKKSHQN